jgi:hypothetical protein
MLHRRSFEVVMGRSPIAGRIFACLGALLGWFTLALQLGLAIRFALARGLSVADGFVIYLGFFTVLTNILVALVLSSATLHPGSRAFLGRVPVKSAVAVHITIVALVYNLLLGRAPAAPQLIADTLLHDVMPPLYIIYWAIFVPKGLPRWIDPVYWLIYPIIYFAYILARGAIIGSYPYSFLDAGALGYPRLALNAVALFVGFLAAGLVCVAIDRALARGNLSGPASASPAPRSASG